MEESLVISAFQKLQTIVANLTNDLLETQNLVSSYYNSVQTKTFKLFAKDKEDPIESSYQHLWFQGVRYSPLFVEQLCIFAHLASPRHLSTAISLLINWLPDKPADISNTFIDGSINYHEYFGLIKDEPKVYLKFVSTIVDMVISDSVAHLMRYYNGENIDIELVHKTIPSLVEYFHSSFKETRFQKNIIPEELWAKLYDSIQEQWKCIYGIISYKWRGFRIEDAVRRSIIEKDLRFQRLSMLKHLKNYEFATNEEIVSSWRCIAECLSETKNNQARELLIDIFASVVSTADNTDREEAYRSIYFDSVKWAKNSATQAAAIHLQAHLIAFGSENFYDINVDRLMEKILKKLPSNTTNTLRYLRSLLVLLRGKYFEFPFDWKVPDQIFFIPNSNYTRRNIQTPLKFECPYATQSLSLFPPTLKTRIGTVFSVFGSKSRILKDVDISEDILSIATEILLQTCSQSAFYFTSFLDEVIFFSKGDYKAKYVAITACQRLIATDTPLDFINSAFSLWNMPFNAELSVEFFGIKIRDTCFREINSILNSPPEILSNSQSDQYLHPKLLFDPFSLICYDVTSEKSPMSTHKIFEYESAKRWKSYFTSLLLRDLNEDISHCSNRVNSVLSGWCVNVSNSINHNLTAIATVQQKVFAPWSTHPKGRKTYSLYMKSIEAIPRVIESALNPESVLSFYECLHHSDFSLVETCSKCIQQIFVRYRDYRLFVIRKFIENAKIQYPSMNRARIMSQLLFILDLLSSLQRMEGILMTEQDGIKIRQEIDMIVLFYLADFSPLVRQLSLRVTKTAFAIWHHQPESSIAYIMMNNASYILEVARYRYLFTLENNKRCILSKDKKYDVFPTIDEVATSRHSAFWFYLLSSIASELYSQKFPLLHDTSELLSKYLDTINEERLSIEKDMPIIVQRMMLLSLKNSISIVIDPSVSRIFMVNEDWKFEYFLFYVSNANTQSMDDLINLFNNWYLSMKKKDLAKIFPKVIRFLRTISCETNFHKLVDDKKRDVIPRLTEIIIDVVREYVIPELSQNKFGNEDIFIDYAYFIYDLSSSLIIPSPYAPFGPLRQSLTLGGIDDLWDIKDRELIFQSIIEWAFYDFTTEINKLISKIADPPKREQKKLALQNTKKTVILSARKSIESLVKLNCFSEPPNIDVLYQLFQIELSDDSVLILPWILAYHFDKLIKIYNDKSYYFRDQYLEGKHYSAAIFDMITPIPLEHILPPPESYIQKEIITYSKIEEDLAKEQKNFAASPLTAQDLTICVSVQQKAAELFLVACYHTISEDIQLREKAFITLHRLIESNFGSMTVSTQSNQSISFRKSIIQYRNSPSIKECKSNAIQLSSIAAKNSSYLTSLIFVEVFKRVPIIGSDELKFWILRIIIPWCDNINFNNFNDLITDEIASPQSFLKNLFQSICIAINSAHRNVPTPVLRVWQSLACSPSEGNEKNVNIMTDFLFSRSFDLQAEDNPNVIYSLCKSMLSAIYITPLFSDAHFLIDKIRFVNVYKTIIGQDNFVKKNMPVSDDTLEMSPYDVHCRTLALDILCSLCESNSFFVNLRSQLHIIFIWSLMRFGSTNKKDSNISIDILHNILFQFQQFFAINDSLRISDDKLKDNLDKWTLLFSCKTTFNKRRLFFPVINESNANTEENENNHQKDENEKVLLSASSSSLTSSNENIIIISSYNSNNNLVTSSSSNISSTLDILFGDSLIATFCNCCSYISPNLTYLCARDSLYWASFSHGKITTILYRIFKYSIEYTKFSVVDFDLSIIHCLISNFLSSFSSIESSVIDYHSNPSLPQYTLKSIPENQATCLEIIDIFITIIKKFTQIHQNELIRFELEIFFTLVSVLNSPLIYRFDYFTSIVSKTFDLVLQMVLSGLFDRIGDGRHPQFEARFSKYRTNKFQGIMPALVKGAYITKLEHSSIKLLRAVIGAPQPVQALLYPFDHSCMFLALTPWIVSQLMLSNNSPNSLAYILCKEFAQNSSNEKIRALAHLATTVNTNQFITNTCTLITLQTDFDLQVISETFQTIIIADRGPTFSSATVVVTSLLFANNQTENFVNHFDSLFTKWTMGARDQDFTVVIPLLEMLRNDVVHTIKNPRKFFTYSTNQIEIDKFSDLHSSHLTLRQSLNLQFLSTFESNREEFRFAKISSQGQPNYGSIVILPQSNGVFKSDHISD